MEASEYLLKMLSRFWKSYPTKRSVGWSRHQDIPGNSILFNIFICQESGSHDHVLVEKYMKTIGMTRQYDYVLYSK